MFKAVFFWMEDEKACVVENFFNDMFADEARLCSKL